MNTPVFFFVIDGVHCEGSDVWTKIIERFARSIIFGLESCFQLVP